MGLSRMGAVVDQFQRLYSGGSVVGLSEWELLRRYLERGDEDAFRAIVASHGPMVMGVCRRILNETRDIEDAFQVTFLILAKKAGKLGEGDPVGHWLYGVAYRVALRARSQAARRHARERTVPAPEVASVEQDPADFELSRVIDEELARLPAKYRSPVVLCYLEGLTHEEAARQLDWPVGTVKGRLSRARDLLKGRLSRRGMAPSHLSSAIGLMPGLRAMVPRSVAERTARAALEVASGRASGMVSASAATLFEEGVRTMILHKLKLGFVALMVLGTGAAVVAYQGSKEDKGVSKKEAAPEKIAAVADANTENPEFSGPISAWPVLTDRSEKTRAIQAKLEQPVAMKFAADTPIQDVLLYIREATRDEAHGLPIGIPIYVDPRGLKDTDKTMASTVRIDLEGIPLKTTLRFVLEQVNLSYQIKDGLIYIDRPMTEDEDTPFDRLMDMAHRGELSKAQCKELIEMLKLRAELHKVWDQMQN